MKLAETKNLLILNRGAIFIALFAYLFLTCTYFLVTGIQTSPFIDSVGFGAYCCLFVGVLHAMGFIKARGLEEDSE